jgi:hypothetical protein
MGRSITATHYYGTPAFEWESKLDEEGDEIDDLEEIARKYGLEIGWVGSLYYDGAPRYAYVRGSDTSAYWGTARVKGDYIPSERDDAGLMAFIERIGVCASEYILIRISAEDIGWHIGALEG